MADIIKSRRDTAENWRTANPTLAEGELGFETDTKRYKLGDGKKAWNDLEYRDMQCVQQPGDSVTAPMSQRAVTNAIENKAEIRDDDSEDNLNIGDPKGNVIAEFKDGHIKTKNFDSFEVTNAIENKAETKNDDSDDNLNIGDPKGNVIAEFKDGHIKTKNFDSSEVTNAIENKAEIKHGDSNADFSIGDERGNVLAEFSNGHIKTKNFDSRGSAGAITPYTKLRFANWNIAHFNMGSGITNVINTEEKYNQYLPIYRKIFNQVNADFLSICEFDSPFYANHPEHTTKRELFPNYEYYKDNATATSNGNWVAFFSHLPLENVREVEFNSHPANAYRYYLVGDLTIGNKIIKVVCTHLTHASPNTYAPAQIQQLIADFANEQYVIILADWNSSPSDFQPLKNAGYSLANNDFLGTLKTSPSTTYEGAMDNIAVKGGSINNITVVDTNEIAGSTLSDHYLIYCDVAFY